MKKLSVLFISAVIFTSCKFEFEKEIDTDFQVADPKLVVNTIFSNQAPMTFTVYRSQPPFGFGSGWDSILTAAQLLIYENDIYKETVTWNGSSFTSTLIPQIGKTYKVVGKYAGLPEVNSTSYIPTAIPIASHSFLEDDGEDENGQPQSSITFVVPDVPGDNYYRIEFLRRASNGDYYKADFDSDDPVLRNDDGFMGEEATTKETFNDVLFPGVNRSLKIKFNKDLPPGVDPRYKLRLQHLSKEAYNYLSKVNIESYSYPEFFVEPVFIYSNIQNGYGIFGGMSSHEIVIQ